MNWKNRFFFVPLLAALTGCVGSIAPIADSSEPNDALLGEWQVCDGTKLEVSRPGPTQREADYQLRVVTKKEYFWFDCAPKGQDNARTYRLRFQRIEGEEYADVFSSCPVSGFVVMHRIARVRHDKDDVLIEPMDPDWWDHDENLKGSGLKVAERDKFGAYLIMGTSSELRTFLAAHTHDRKMFVGADQDNPNDGRLKRYWTEAEAKGCAGGH